MRRGAGQKGGPMARQGGDEGGLRVRAAPKQGLEEDLKTLFCESVLSLVLILHGEIKAKQRVGGGEIGEIWCVSCVST